jgi:DNA-binding HxlR family transcriptional regulator
VDGLASEPDWAAFSAENCSAARTLALVGEKWTLLLLREAYYGTRRFTDFQARLGLARNLLTARLQTLVDGGLLTRVPYREPGTRTRHEYRLTDAGRELFPVLVALLQWGDTHLADVGGPAAVLQHRDCGQPVHAVVECAAGHRPLAPRDVRLRPGPGARLVRNANAHLHQQNA